MRVDAKKGGELIGKRHKQGGIKTINTDTGDLLEVEGGEMVVKVSATQSPKKHSIDGRKMTNKEIMQAMNEDKLGKGGEVKKKRNVSFVDVSDKYEVLSETDKAVKLEFEINGKNITSFFPKKAIQLGDKLKVKKSFWKHKKVELTPKTIYGEEVKIWQPEKFFARIYFEDNSYLQLSSKERSPKGYYERHRYAKGSDILVTFVKASGGLAKKAIEQLSMKGDWYEDAKPFYFAIPAGETDVVFLNEENKKMDMGGELSTNWDSLTKKQKLAKLIKAGWDNGKGKPNILAKQYAKKKWNDLPQSAQYILQDEEESAAYGRVYMKDGGEARSENKEIETEMMEIRDNKYEGEGQGNEIGFGNLYLDIIFGFTNTESYE